MLIVWLIIVSLMVALYFACQEITLNAIAISENEDAESHAQRFVNNLSIDLANLNSTVNDWASWDDTYRFIQDNNTAYIESNLPDETFVNLQLNIMLFINESRQLTYGKMYDFNNETSSLLQESDIQQVLSNEAFFSEDPQYTEAGLLLMGETPMLVTAHPILTSLHGGPALGTLIMGRYFDQAELGALSEAAGLPLSTSVVNNPYMSEDFLVANESLTSDKPIFTHELNETHIAGYVLLQDTTGAPLLIVRVDSYRGAYLQGKQSLFYTGLSFVAIEATIFFALAILMEKLVLSRLSALNETVIEIGKIGDYGRRAAVKGHDELSNLAKNINGMLDIIQKSREELREYAETLERRVEERTRELKTNQEKLRSIVSASPDAIIVIDLEANIIECNEQMTKLCGSSREDLIGKSAPSFVVEDDRQRIYDEFVNIAYGRNEIAHTECILIKKDHTRYPAELSVSVVKDAQGKLVGFVAIIRDLTERKQIEQRLFKSERLAAIGELAGMIGHDLRNPLTGMKNAVYFLKKKDFKYSDDAGKPMFDVIDNCIEHSNKIINDLVEYSREMHLDLRDCSPKSLLKESLEMFKVPSHIKLVDNTLRELAMEADIEKMKRVFINLIKNAVDAMPQQGKLEIGSSQTDRTVVITFADTGTGISEETMKNLFAPLFTTKSQGMGFGLAICKRVVEAHGGKIEVESVPGEGTKFTVTLPIKPEVENREWQ